MPLILLLALTRTGTLVVETPHYGATISVDRRPIGTAPVEPRVLPTGWHLVEVFARERPPWGRLVFVPPGKTVRVSVRLAPLPAQRRRASTDAGAPPPTWSLTGRAGVRAALRGPDRSVALVQRARLDGQDVLGADTRLVVDLGGESRIVDRGQPLLRLIAPGRASRLRIDAAWAGWRGLRAGRLPLSGPGDTAVVLDGIDGGVSTLGWRLAGRVGGRGAPVGARPDALLAGVGLTRERGPLTGRVRWWHHATHHLDGRLATRGDRWQIATAGSLVGDRLHRARVDTRWDAVHLGYAVRGPGVSRLVDPLRSLRLDPLDRTPWHGPRIALDGQAGPWRGDGALRLRISDAGARLDGAMGIIRDLAGWRAGARLRGVVSRWESPPPRPFLRHRVGAALTARWGQRLDAALGAAWQATDRSRRVLPEGAARLRWPLVDRLSVEAEISAAAVDPAVLPGDGPLLTGLLGVRLR